MKLTHDVEYALPFCDGTVIIPAGTRLVRCDNLPPSSGIAYWAQPWRGMTANARAHLRNYGFAIHAEEAV